MVALKVIFQDSFCCLPLYQAQHLQWKRSQFQLWTSYISGKAFHFLFLDNKQFATPALEFSSCWALSFSSVSCLSQYIFGDSSVHACPDRSAVSRAAFTECLLSEWDFDRLCCFKKWRLCQVFLHAQWCRIIALEWLWVYVFCARLLSKKCSDFRSQTDPSFPPPPPPASWSEAAYSASHSPVCFPAL